MIILKEAVLFHHWVTFYMNSGNVWKLEWFYRKMLEQDSLDDNFRGILYYKIGMIRFEKEDYPVALDNFEKSAQLMEPSNNETTIPRPLYMYKNRSLFLTLYNNKAFIHHRTSKFGEAVEHYKKALEEEGSKVEQAAVHNNLGLLYFDHGDYTEACDHHWKAVDLVNESCMYWAEFKRNSNRADKRLQRLTS